jgi:hypothetical protein
METPTRIYPSQTKILTLQRALYNKKELLDSVIDFLNKSEGFLDVNLFGGMNNSDKLTVRCAICDLFPDSKFISVRCDFDSDISFSKLLSECYDITIIELFNLKPYHYNIHNIIEELYTKKYNTGEILIIIR